MLTLINVAGDTVVKRELVSLPSPSKFPDTDADSDSEVLELYSVMLMMLDGCVRGSAP